MLPSSDCRVAGSTGVVETSEYFANIERKISVTGTHLPAEKKYFFCHKEELVPKF